ncbi:uncharacterized protein LOC116656076 [Drosophila ananassae]|uniref:uncharacterized protein LOC116656076 n=1 Tax=Drosophila ananassae TaxID=7217 RepID=UPI0013A5F237|nr:uncharacterized protein LOC116656076 [Drosophila ananassae]
MFPSVKIILTVAILATFVCSGYSIKCYYCSSAVYNNSCGIHFLKANNSLYNCPNANGNRPAVGCSKYMNSTTVTRECFYGNRRNATAECNKSPYASNCTVCFTDGCNSSSSLLPMVGGILLMLGVARFLA